MILLDLIDLYSLVVLAAVVMSWLQVPYNHPIAQIIHKLTDPALGPIRRLLPAFGGLDFSPMLLLIGLQMLKGFVARAL
jgi:YggT family protein